MNSQYLSSQNFQLNVYPTPATIPNNYRFLLDNKAMTNKLNDSIKDYYSIYNIKVYIVLFVITILVISLAITFISFNLNGKYKLHQNRNKKSALNLEFSTKNNNRTKITLTNNKCLRHNRKKCKQCEICSLIIQNYCNQLDHISEANFFYKNNLCKSNKTKSLQEASQEKNLL